MYVTNLLFAAIGLFALLKFVISPRIDRQARLDQSAKSVSKYALRNTVDFLSLFLLLSIISLIFSLGITFYLNSTTGVTLEEVQKKLFWVQNINDFVSTLGKGWTYLTTILLAVGLAIYSYKKTTKQSLKRVEKAYQKEIDRLQQVYEQGEWEELEPTDQMKIVYDKILEYDQVIEELSQENENNQYDADIANLIQQRENFINAYQSLDLERRVDLDIEPEIKFKIPKNLKDKIKLFFISQGLLNTLKKGGVVTFLIGTILLFPSMLGIVSENVKDVANAKRIQLEETFDDLSFKILVQDSKQQLKEAVAQSKQASDAAALSEEDDQVLDQIAKVFEENAFGVRVAGQSARIASNAVVRHNAKEKILARLSSKNQQLMLAKATNISSELQDVLKIDSLSRTQNGPVTPLGKQFRKDLVSKVVNKDQNTWRQIKRSVKSIGSSFQTPASPRQIKSMMISNVVGNIMQVTETHGVTKIAHDGFSSIAGNTAANLYEVESNKFIVELAKSNNLDDALKQYSNLKKTVLPRRYQAGINAGLGSIPGHSEIKSAFDSRPPSLSAIDEPHVNSKRSSELVKAIAKSSGRNAAMQADALASFADYFPGYKGEDLKTNKAKTLGKTAQNQKVAYNRARSYTKLRGFSRIGGVLIGRMPDEEVFLDTENFRWEKHGEFIDMYIKLARQPEVKLGSFHQEIVYPALGYAADGRVTTVTMVSSAPVYDLKILLHPALIDSTLGCYAIRLDQIADEQSSLVPQIMEARTGENTRIDNIRTLYQLAWALQLKEIFASNSLLLNANPDFEDYLIYATKVIEQLTEVAKEIIQSGEFNLKFAKEKSAFFLPEIVKNIESCAVKESFNTCISQNVPTKFSSISSLDNPIWLYPAPETTEWSGVREQSFVLKEDLTFFNAGEDDSLLPLRFMVQRVFTSEPYFAEEPNEYVDNPPYEFKEVNALFKQYLPLEIEKNNEKKQVSRVMREFVKLQRLFRLALNGNLGESFPVNSLVDLADSIEIKNVRTLRWLPKSGVAEQLAQMEVIRGSQPEKAKEKLQLITELRKELGIVVDERQLSDPEFSVCPVLY